MQTAFNPLATICQSQIEASRRFSEALFSGTERIDRVFLDAGHRMFLRQLKFVQTVTSAPDPQGAMSAMQAGLMPHGPGEFIHCQQEFMHAVVDMQNDFGKSLQDYIGQLGRHAPPNAGTASVAPASAGSIYGAGLTMPGNGMHNPMASLFAMWEAAFREIAAFTQKNLLGAHTAMENAATQAFSGADKAAMAVASRVHDGAGIEAQGGESGAPPRGHADDAEDERKRNGGGGRKK